MTNYNKYLEKKLKKLNNLVCDYIIDEVSVHCDDCNGCPFARYKNTYDFSHCVLADIIKESRNVYDTERKD